MSLPRSNIPALPVLVVGTACLLAIAPFFWHGSPSGHDFEFHLFSWMDVLAQWKEGILYPRWAASAHWGYGEARFLFYPPASWAIGAALGALLPWKIVPGAYCWIALTLAGISMHRLAREWLAPSEALFAAVLYAVNPYHILIVYWRSAFAELLAAALLPLLLYAVVRLTEAGSRPVLWLGLVLGAAWLTNAPAAVMIHYSVAGLAAVNAIVLRTWRPLWRTALAVLLGAGLASFYLVPTVYETRWVSIDQVLAPGLRPQDNFLFTNIPDVEHNQFNLLISTVAALEIGVLILAIWGSRGLRLGGRKHWTLLACWGGAAGLIMISIANPLWQILPKLRFVQLPWRWLLCMNAALALLLTMASRKWTLRALAIAVLLGAVVAAGYRIQLPWWDQASDITEMSDAVADGSGYEGSDEYVPTATDPYELKKDAPQVLSSHPETTHLRVLQWDPADKHIVVQTKVAESLTLRLLSYPAWEATINGQRVTTQTAEVTGQIVLTTMPGTNDIRIHFARTPDRTIGDTISLLSLLMCMGIWIQIRRTVQPLR